MVSYFFCTVSRIILPKYQIGQDRPHLLAKAPDLSVAYHIWPLPPSFIPSFIAFIPLSLLQTHLPSHCSLNHVGVNGEQVAHADAVNMHVGVHVCVL